MVSSIPLTVYFFVGLLNEHKSMQLQIPI